MKHRIFSVYRCFDADGDLLYVGASIQPLSRIWGHVVNSPWIHLVKTINVEVFEDKMVMAASEKKAIQDEGPRFNITYSKNPAKARCELEKLKASKERASIRDRCKYRRRKAEK